MKDDSLLIEIIPSPQKKLIDTKIQDEPQVQKHDQDPSKLCQWQYHGDGKFAPCTKTQQTIPPGVYQPAYSNTLGEYLKCISFRNDELLLFPDPIYVEIINSIKSFWAKREYYNKYEFTYKRGVLLYGEPGCGKSCIISQCISYLVQQLDGIVVNITNSDQLQIFSDFLPNIREIEPNRPIITILEDLDALVQRRSSSVLNLLDGVKQVDNIIYIATTNYPELLEERILNRPSRFDRRFHIGTPSAEVRKFYFQNKIKSEDLKNLDLKKWVSETEGFSIAHLKELIISVFVLDFTFEYSLAQLNGMMKNSGVKGCSLKKSSGIGF